MSKIPSIVDLINASKNKNEDAIYETAAFTVKQQEMMEREGELTPVMLIGPNDTLIPAYFSKAENAFLPQFSVEK